MKKLILICGKKRSGKDTLARLIQKYQPGCEIFEMPGRIKECTAETIGITASEFDTYKDDAVIKIETKDGRIIRETPLRSAAIALGNKMKKPFAGKQFWIKERLDAINKTTSEVVILTGMRLRKEISYFKLFCEQYQAIDVHIIKTVRPGFEMPKDGTELDRTETEVDSLEYTYLSEAENLSELEKNAKEFVNNNL